MSAVSRTAAAQGIDSASIPITFSHPALTPQPGSVRCDGQIISRIDIHPHPPFTLGGPKMVSRIAQFLTLAHATTAPSVIRRYLALHVGDACTEVRRRESERILRAQPFLADALVTAYPDSSGGVTLDVTTIDEISLIAGGKVSGKSPLLQDVRLGEANFDGRATYVSGEWQNSQYFRDIFRGRLVDYQFLGRPYQFALQGARNELGGSWDMEMSHPFITDLQRYSWRVTSGSSKGYIHFLRPDAPDAALAFTRSYGDIGAVRVFGSPGRLFLAGLSASRERESTGSMPVIIDNALYPDTSQVLMNRYGEHNSTRLNLLLGLRHLDLLRVTGFDAVEGAQDVRTGIQLSGLIGKGFRVASEDERDYFFSGDVYVGEGTPTSFLALEMTGERRRDVDTHQWDGSLASGRLAWYTVPSTRETAIASLEFSGGWQQRVPFQVSFQDLEGGLRGYNDSRLAGGQRLVLRLEDRYRLGHIRQFTSLAGAVFVDAGKLYAGDVPFGVTTGIKYAVGIGLLAAVPPQSRRTWRMDLAYPINDRGDAHQLEIRFSNEDFTRWFWHEPGDIQTSRERAVPNSVYNWP